MSVSSYLTILLLVITLVNNVAYSSFPFRPPKSTCVWTERQLRKVIANATKSSNVPPTRITICRSTILVSNTTNSLNITGIDVSDRFIDLRCKYKRSLGGCTLDGQGLSRIFYGERTDLTVKNINFVNANPYNDFYDYLYGGAVLVTDSSRVSFTGCSFKNNGRTFYDDFGLYEFRGGAIFLRDSTLKINGGSKMRPVVFSDNGADHGAAVVVESGNFSISGYTVFSNNKAFRTNGAVYLRNTDTSSFKNVVFESNTANSAGAMYADGNGTLHLENVKFMKNFANYSAALLIFSSPTTMKSVEFIENSNGNSDGSIIFMYGASLQATDCTFSNHNSTVIDINFSNVILQNSTFSKNKSINNLGADFMIADDDNPSSGGTFVKCESNTVFCNGLGDSSIYEEKVTKRNRYNNTDCKARGVVGTPGVGTCPI